jgi:hypothetical protein
VKSLYAVSAEFETVDALLKATRRLTELGYQKMDAYTPFPIAELDEALPPRYNPMPKIALTGGILGASSGYFMQWYSNVIDYPIRVAGRPYHSWPAFIPITFELGVLGAALFSVFGMLMLNRLPLLHHPIADTIDFDRASMDRFFLAVQAQDPIFSEAQLKSELLGLGASRLSSVFADHHEEKPYEL